MRTALFVMGISAMTAVACTPHQIYSVTRVFHIDECQKLPLPEQEECMHRAHEPYHEYEKRRKEEVERNQ